MTTCEHIRQAGLYHDGEMAADARRAFEDHLAACAGCRREVRRLQALSRFLAGADIPEASPAVLERLHAGVGVVRERLVVRLAEILTAAAAVVLFVCGALLWRSAEANTVHPAAASPWEQVAVTLRVETLPAEPARFAQWIVEDLSSENSHE